mmetsp:Transcript_18219/g.43838  ORF Transcript_18219/g.43838 Transcript_18219/m.43838 type:complete len:231 (-) Transcript_18219:2235-2927(-)
MYAKLTGLLARSRRQLPLSRRPRRLSLSHRLSRSPPSWPRRQLPLSGQPRLSLLHRLPRSPPPRWKHPRTLQPILQARMNGQANGRGLLPQGTMAMEEGTMENTPLAGPALEASRARAASRVADRARAASRVANRARAAPRLPAPPGLPPGHHYLTIIRHQIMMTFTSITTHQHFPHPRAYLILPEPLLTHQQINWSSTPSIVTRQQTYCLVLPCCMMIHLRHQKMSQLP